MSKADESAAASKRGYQKVPAILTIASGLFAGIAVFLGNLTTISDNFYKLINKTEIEPDIKLRDAQIINILDNPSQQDKFWVQVVIDKKAGAKITECAEFVSLDGSELRSGTSLSFGEHRYQKVVSLQFDWNKKIVSPIAKVRMVCDQIVTPWVEFSTKEIQSKAPPSQDDSQTKVRQKSPFQLVIGKWVNSNTGETMQINPDGDVYFSDQVMERLQIGTRSHGANLSLISSKSECDFYALIIGDGNRMALALRYGDSNCPSNGIFDRVSP